MQPHARQNGGAANAAENIKGLLATNEQPPEQPPQHARHFTALSMQARKMLDLLRAGPQSTLDLIEQHGIVRPGARAHDLRDAGYILHTERVRELDEHGRPHRLIAKYHLLVGGAV